MSTLKFKALSIKTCLVLFIKAMGVYLLLTIPALVVEPVMYMVSAGYALAFGWIAAVLFYCCFMLIENSSLSYSAKCLLLYLSVAVGVAAGLQAIQITGAWPDVWHAGSLLVFPGAAVLAGWTSLIISRRQVGALLSNEQEPVYLTIDNQR